jgi:cytochrome c peroxidase
MKNTFIIPAIILFLAVSACQNKKKMQQAAGPKADSVLLLAKNVFQPLPAEALNPENPITPAKVLLGKTLYFDKRLSMHNTQSCNTCHNLSTYGVDNKSTSPGDNGKPGTRNSPTTFNSALHFVQFWDGRMKDVEEQAGGPVMNPVEMNMPTEKELIQRFNANEGYKKMFAAAFPNDHNPVTFANMRKSIAAFERTLITSDRFDKFLGGDLTALNAGELKGLKTFIGTGCSACHSGSLLGGTMFQKYPLFYDHKTLTGSAAADYGRMQATKDEADKYVFKVPSLRNIAGTHPYLHDGSVKDLDKAITIMAKAQLNKGLTKEQVSDINTFLNALTAEIPAEVKKEPVMPF